MFVPKENRFTLAESTVYNLRTMEPDFGEIGEFVFYRTYSRAVWDRDRDTGELVRDENGDPVQIGQERWWQVIKRVIEGVLSIRKNHYIRNRIRWDEDKWQETAYKMAVSAFKMEWMPPGRGLWAMGTDYIYERGGMALFNCAFVEVRENIGKAAYWTMDALMNGVGVGFRPYRNDLTEVVEPPEENEETYVIPDSREGWCESVQRLIDSYLRPDQPKWTFDYSEIRPEGSPIRGFGGRASGPGPLKELHERIRTYFRKYREWRNNINPGSEILDPEHEYDSMRLKVDIFNAIGCCVVAGNVRRSAEISLAPVSDPTFADLKDYEKHPDRAEIGWMSNNSVILETPEDFAKLGEIAERVIKNGEPGYLNMVNVKRGRLRVGKASNVREDKATGLNPCMTGDTLVLTADGRGAVPIRELAESGQDVRVFTELLDGSLGIHWMRRPRATGKKVAVYKVVLDSGDILRLTGNHKLYLRGGQETKAVEELSCGDSLRILSRYFPDGRSESRADQYNTFSIGGETRAEHRLIAQAHFGIEPRQGLHVHHINGRKTDNRTENLEIRSEFPHLSEHSDGESNSRYCGVTNDALLEHGVNLAGHLGRRFSKQEWQEYAVTRDLPTSFSKFRKAELGTITAFAKRCAAKAGVEDFSDCDPRTVRLLHELLESGLEAGIVDGRVMVTKVCEATGETFIVPSNRREQAYASHEVSLAAMNSDPGLIAKRREGRKKTFDARRENVREQQIAVFLDLSFELGRTPKKMEWVEACRASGVSSEICRKSSPFQSWKDLEKRADGYNHKVISVEFDGYEDVYNGTVDETHRFFIGGFAGTTDGGRDKEVWVSSKQCGEVPLESFETCNIAETLPTRCNTVEDWLNACRYAAIYCSSVNLLPTHSPETNRVVARNRRIGVGLVDLTGWKAAHPINKVTRWLRDGYNLIREVNRDLAAEAGIPESIRVTTVKPGGTTPKLAGRTSGIGYPTFRHTLMRVRVSETAPVVSVLQDAGVPCEPDKVNPKTLVFEFPVLQGPAKPATEASLWEQAANLMFVQREWSDNAVSNTLFFKPKWVLTKAWKPEALPNSDELQGFLFGLHDPIIDPHDAPRILRTLSESEEYADSAIRITSDSTGMKLYRFNPMHEEDQIEDVLSTLAPVTKSVSLLPHTAAGVYAQSPQEGITEEEYNRRRAAIRPLDWSEYVGSDGEDPLFCSGPNCQEEQELRAN